MMKTFKRFIATLISGLLSLPYMLFAQDEGTYIDNLGVQDSSYMEQDMLAEGANSSGSGSTIIIIIVILVVIAVIAFLLKKRKK